jgi:hypothetical protein
VISVPPGGLVAVSTPGENRAPPPETNNNCQVKFELIHLSCCLWLIVCSTPQVGIV